MRFRGDLAHRGVEYGTRVNLRLHVAIRPAVFEPSSSLGKYTIVETAPGSRHDVFFDQYERDRVGMPVRVKAINNITFIRSDIKEPSPFDSN